MEADTTALRPSATNDAAKNMCPCLGFAARTAGELKFLHISTKITELSHPLQDILVELKKKTSILIKHNGIGYTRNIHAFTVLSTFTSDDKSIKSLIVDGEVHKRREPSMQVALVDGRHRLAAISQLASRSKVFILETKGSFMILVNHNGQRSINPSKIVFYGRSCNTLASLVI